MERLDLVIFGASGFTGGFVVIELAKVAAVEKLTWGVAGRDASKLKQALQKAEDETGISLSHIRVIVADVSSHATVVNMCQQAKVLLNCVGPFRCYGEQVVKTCIASGTHHLDVSGEPEFLERMEYLYDTAAMTAGVYVVGSCGFDSIPSDMGVLFTRKAFKGDLQSIEGFININSSQEKVIVNYGTYESAVYSLANWNNLAQLRRNMAQLRADSAPKASGKLPKRGKLFTLRGMSGCYTPEFGADGSVVHRTQRRLAGCDGTTPVLTRFYVGWRTKISAIIAVVFGAMFLLLSKFAFGRRLLLAYPGFFSGGLVSRHGPSRKHIDNSSFSITFLGKRAAQQQQPPSGATASTVAAAAAAQKNAPVDLDAADIVTRVRGPEVGYVTTVRCLIQAGITVLKEKDRLPKGGGVFTPGAIFLKTSLIARLMSREVIFEVLKSKQL